MNKIYSLILSAVLAIGAFSADAAYRSVVVKRHDGSSVRVGIESDIKATITDGSLVFACSKGEISFPMEEVDRWTFSSSPGSDNIWSAIEVNEADAIGFARESTRLLFRNLEEGARVTLTAIDGRTVVDTRCTDSSLFTVETAGLPGGIYIVSYSDHSLKIVLSR